MSVAAAFNAAFWRALRFSFMALFLAVLIWSPIMPALEGTLFPVTSGITPLGPLVAAADGGLDFRFAYTKLRLCEYKGTSATDSAGGYVEFGPLERSTSTSRDVGPQVSALWHLGAPSLAGIRVVFLHRCGPLWLTRTLATIEPVNPS